MSRIKSLCRIAREFSQPCRGIAAIEFAFAAPLFVLLMLGTTDLTFYIENRLKLDATSDELAEIVTQYTELYSSDFATLFNDAQMIAGNVVVSGQFGATIISGVTNNNGAPAIAWQQISSKSSFHSQFGTVGSAPQLPGGYVPPPGVTLVVTEVYTTVTPWVFSASIMGGSGTTVISSVSLFQPRLASLSTITPGTRS